MRKILYVGLDVDDKSFHGAGFCQNTGETLEFRSKPTKKALLNKLRELQKKGFELKTCYETSFLGYSLHRFLDSRGIDNGYCGLFPDPRSFRPPGEDRPPGRSETGPIPGQGSFNPFTFPMRPTSRCVI